MEPLTLVIFFLASVILLIGFIGEVIFKRTNIPDMIWLILFGILLSFFLSPSQKDLLIGFAGPFGTLALIMILFNSGLEFDLVQFSKGIGRGTLLTLVSFFLTLLVTGVSMHYLLGWPWLYGILLGTAVGGTSSGVIIPIITRIKCSEKLKSILTVESTATDILVIIFAVSIIQLIKTGTLDWLNAFKNITAAFSIGIMVGVVGAIGWLFISKDILKEIRTYLLDFTLVLFIYVFTEFIGGAGAIAALTFGLILGNIEWIKRLVNLPEGVKVSRGERTFYSELNFLVRTFFFVYLGTLFNFSSLEYLGIGVLLVLIFWPTRLVSSFLAGIGSEFSRKEKIFVSVMFGRGLAAAVVAQLPLVVLGPVIKDPKILGILESFPQIVLSVIFFSILATVIGVYSLGKNLPVSGKKVSEKEGES